MMYLNNHRPEEERTGDATLRRPIPSSTIMEQVRGLDPRLAPDSARFQAAAVLLAALQVGQNIDRLARYTGYERNWIAKIARRLVDNGIWQNGETIGGWYHDGNPCRDSEAQRAFWNDAGVAEGMLCRRIGDGGEMEWAAAGVWSKHYEYVEIPSAGLSILYHTPPTEEAPDAYTPAESENADSDPAEPDNAPEHPQSPYRTGRERRRKRAFCRRTRPRRSAFGVPRRDKVFHPSPQAAATSEEPPLLLPDLFPDATWLG